MNKIFRYLNFQILLLVIVPFSFSQNQQKIDSLETILKTAKPDSSKVNILINLCYELSMNDPEKSLHFGQQSLQLAQKINYKKGIASCYSNIGVIYCNQGNYYKALLYYEKSLNKYKELRDKSGVSVILNNIGNIHIYQGSYTLGLEYYLKSLKISEELNDKASISSCLSNIGNIYTYQANYPLGIEYYQKSLKISDELSDKAGVSACYNNIGSVYIKQGNYPLAIEYLQKSLKIQEELGNRANVSVCLLNIGIIQMYKGDNFIAIEYFQKALKMLEKLGDKAGISNCLTSIGNAQENKGNYLLAIKFYQQSLKIKEEINDKNGISSVLYSIASLNIKLKRYPEAKKYGLQSLNIAKEINALENIKNAADVLSESYEKSGNFKKAYEYHKYFKKINDSIFNVNSNRQIHEMEEGYQSEKKEKEISLLNEKAKYQELVILQEKDKKRNQLILFFCLFVFTLTIILLLFSRNKIKQKEALNSEKLKNQKEQLKSVIDTQEKERIRFARDIHDGIGQYFSALKLNISKFENEDKLNNDQKVLLFKNVMKLIDDLYHEIHNISFDIMPQILSIKGLIPSLKELTEKNNKLSNISIHLDVFEFNQRLPQHIEIALYRIIQEFLNNIIKYSQASHVNIHFTKHEKELNLLIEDNGTGFNTDTLKQSAGHGWKNIKSRIEMINGTIEIDSIPNRVGTTVIIYVPLNTIKQNDY